MQKSTKSNQKLSVKSISAEYTYVVHLKNNTFTEKFLTQELLQILDD